jgi:hypothetical protein
MSWILRVHSGAEGVGESSFTLMPIARKHAWKTVALDGAGRACRRALMLEDGQVLPATGVIALAYETAEGKSHRRDEVVTCDANGAPLPLLAPTRDRPQMLEPVAPEDLLEYATTAIYAASPQRLDADLEQALRQGRIFRTRFRPRATTHERPAFLLAGRRGIFLLLGERLEFTPCVREIPLPPEDEEGLQDDEFWDDEEDWMRMDVPITEGAPIGSHGDNGEMSNMDFEPWASASGEESI